jgi:hypothetical protein
MAAKLRNRQTVILLLVFFLSPVLALSAGIGKALNIIGLCLMIVLFLGCVLLLPADELTPFYRFASWVFLLGFLLNLCYELLHSPLYTHFTESGYTYPELVLMLLTSAVADAFIALTLLFAVTVFRRGQWRWTLPWKWKNVLFVIVFALVGQVIGELVALNTGEWAYNAAMPLIPGLRVGLTPVLQMPLLILPTLWLAQRATCPSGA